jgi:hypothetical protein
MFGHLFSLEARVYRHRAFDDAFGKKPATTTETPLADRVRPVKVDVETTATPGTEAYLRLKHGQMLHRLRQAVVLERNQQHLTDQDVELLLNILARDLLPGHYLCKVRKVAAR